MFLGLSFGNVGEGQLVPVPTDLECKHMLCEPTNLQGAILGQVLDSVFSNDRHTLHTVHLHQLLCIA